MNYKLSDCKAEGLVTYGLTCLDNGFEPVPVPFKKKAPAIKGWQNLAITRRQMLTWAESPSRATDGIGLRTGELTAVDIDVYDEALRDKVMDIFMDMTGLSLGELVLRVGQWPKCLVVMRSGSPYRKKSTAVWEDWAGDGHKIEVLGKGQHFMAAGVHPDTNEPFKWSTDLERLAIDDLPVFAEMDAEAFVAAVEKLFEDEGLEIRKRKSNVTTLTAARSERASLIDADDFDDVAPIKSDFTKDDIQEALDLINGRVDENYDFWLEIGMILHRVCTLHSKVLSETEAFAMWDEWSMASVNYDSEEVTSKWQSFSSKRGDAVGHATLFMYAKEARVERRKQYSADMSERIREAEDIETLTGPVIDAARRFVTEHNLNNSSRDLLAQAISDRARELGRTLSKSVVSREIAPPRRYAPIVLPEGRKLEREEIDQLEGFGWCQEWLYVTSMDHFYNKNSHELISAKSFDMRYGWYFTPVGEMHCMVTPAKFMSNLYKIDTITSVLAMPDRPAGFSQFDGHGVWNIHHEPSLTALDESKWSDYQRKYVDYFKRHMLLCVGGDQIDADIFTAWLAYAFIYPERRIQWFTLMCGMEGTGKSLIYLMAEHQLGERFANKVSSEELTGSRFNSWADGKYFLCFEELKMAGHSRHAVQNKLKDYSNAKIPIEHKGKGTYKAPNYAKIFAASNYFDAVIPTATDRRWFIGYNELETEQDLLDFLEETPDHFTVLYDGVSKIEKVSEAMSALRGYLKSVADNPCEEFKQAMHTQRAPMTRAKKQLIDQEEPPLVEELRDLMRSRKHGFINKDLVSLTDLMELVEQDQLRSLKLNKNDSKGRDMMIRSTLPRLLTEAPFSLTCSTRKRINGVRHKFYFRRPPKGADEAECFAARFDDAISKGAEPVPRRDEDADFE